MPTFEFTELLPNGLDAAAGVRIPDRNGGSTFIFQIVAPLATPFADFEGRYTAEPFPTEAEFPFAPTGLQDDAEFELTRFDRGPSCTDEEGIARRLKVASSVEPVELPRKGLIPTHCVARRVIAGKLRLSLEGYALPPHLAADVLRSQITERSLEQWTSEDIASVLADVLGTKGWYDHDCFGNRLDEQHARAEADRLGAERKAAEQRQAEEATNTKTCAELGVVAIRVPDHVFRPLSFLSTQFDGISAAIGRYADVTKDGYRYTLWDARLFAGALPPVGRAPEFLDEVMPQHFVPPLSCKTVREARGFFSMSVIQALRQRRLPHVDRAPVEDFLDLRSPDGVFAEEGFERAVRSIAEEAARFGTDSRSHGLWHHATEIGIRGYRLLPDVVFDALRRVADPVHERNIPHQDRVMVPAYEEYVTWSGDIHLTPAGFDSATPHDHYGSPYKEVRRTPAVMWRRPEIYLTRERFYWMAADAISGKNACIAVGEFLEPPKAGWLARIGEAFRRDPIGPALDKLIASAAGHLTSDVIEAALIEAGVCATHEVEGKRKRIKELLERRGWEKRHITLNGGRTWAFVPRDGGAK